MSTHGFSNENALSQVHLLFAARERALVNFVFYKRSFKFAKQMFVVSLSASLSVQAFYIPHSTAK